MTIGVLVMSYGTPSGPEDVQGFYTDVRRGRPPSAEQLEELQRRYEAIGGLSPLSERSAAQRRAIAAALDNLAPGGYVTRDATKHGRPSIEQVVDDLAASGTEGLVGLVLAPHFSHRSVGEYLERGAARSYRHGLAWGAVEDFHDDPALVAALAARVIEAGTALSSQRPGGQEVVFSAHSLPAHILEEGDPYPDQLAATARLVAGAAGCPSWRVSYQSASPTGVPWLGPDILETLERVAEEGFASVLVCPAGFTSDHLEILYDLDIQARRRAGELGIAFARTASLNDDHHLAEALARRIVAATPGARSGTSSSAKR